MLRIKLKQSESNTKLKQIQDYLALNQNGPKIIRNEIKQN